MKTQLIMIIAWAFTCLQYNAVYAQSKQLNIVATAVPFLRVSPDAKAGGMAEMGVATAPDAAASFYNIAKTSFASTKSAIGFNYTPWLRDIADDVYLASLSAYHKIDEQQTITVGFRYFSLGNIQFTDNSGNLLNSHRPRELALEAGYSRKISTKNSLGVNLRYINSSLAVGDYDATTYKTGNAVAADVGFYHYGISQAGNGITYGVVLSNLGSKIGYTSDAAAKDFIPANLGAGVTYSKTIDEDNKLTVGAEINKLLVPSLPASTGDPVADNAALVNYRAQSTISSWFKSVGDAPGGLGEELSEISVGVGGEYIYNDQFGIRAGYHYEDVDKGNRSYFTVGVGFNYSLLSANLSYIFPAGQGTAYNALSNTMRLGISSQLSKNK
jgi:hypothetical protein